MITFVLHRFFSDWLRGLSEGDGDERLNKVKVNLANILDGKVKEGFTQSPEKMSKDKKVALDAALLANGKLAHAITVAEMKGEVSDVPDDIARKFPWHLHGLLPASQRKEQVIFRFPLSLLNFVNFHVYFFS